MDYNIAGLVAGVALLALAFRLESRRAGRRIWLWPILTGLAGIAAMVTGILIPVFVSAQVAAERAGCMQSLKKDVLALILYTSDHDDRYPDSASWQTDAASYGQLGKCPKSEAGLGYAMNEALSRIKDSDLVDPMNTIVLFDSTVKSGGKAALDRRHGGMAFVALADGHAHFLNEYWEAKFRWHP